MKAFKHKKRPYICVPITGQTKEEVMQQLDIIVEQAPDVIEWRADFFSHLDDVEQTIEIVNEMKRKTDIPLLLTIRAEHEGGENIDLKEEEKVDLIQEICQNTSVDIIDYETSNDKRFVEKVRETTKENGQQLILSYHHFSETPEDQELIERAKQAKKFGADMIKIAVMSQSKDDVFRLLEVTRKIDQMIDKPLITMSMGDIGALSRIIGWVYGSILTFGVGVKSSAPGQIEVGKLREAIEKTQELLPSWK